MDPLTHAAAGAAAAVTIETQGGWRRQPSLTALIVGTVAGISPDIDYFDMPFGSGLEGLSYMLYHRGLTHTIVGCVLLAAMIVAPFNLFSRQRRRSLQLFWIALAGALLHVLMDGTNDYGIHPFWPFWNGWIYGDFIFLLEPLVVASVLPLAAWGVLRDWGSRARNLVVLSVVVTLIGAMLGLLWLRVAQGRWVTTLAATIATVFLIAQLLLAASVRRYPLVAWGSLVGVWLVFFLASRMVKTKTKALLAATTTNERVVQLTTTPAAANPLCWRVVTASVDEARDAIVARMAAVSLLPSWIRPDSCRTATPRGPATFQLQPIDIRDRDEAWHWLGRATTSLSLVKEVSRRNCRVREATRFLRTPVLQVGIMGSALLGDLRLDYEEDDGRYCKYRFQTDEVPHCNFKPPWM